MLVVIALLVSQLSVADSKYNYVTLEYGLFELDNGFDGSSIGVSGSYDVAENMNLLLYYTTSDFDNSNIEQTSLGIGAGYHFALSEETDFFSEFVVYDVDTDYGDTTESDSGKSIELGVTHLASNVVELGVSLAYADIAGESDTYFNVGLGVGVEETTALTAIYSLTNDAESINVGIQKYF